MRVNQSGVFGQITFRKLPVNKRLIRLARQHLVEWLEWRLGPAEEDIQYRVIFEALESEFVVSCSVEVTVSSLEMWTGQAQGESDDDSFFRALRKLTPSLMAHPEAVSGKEIKYLSH